MRAIYSYYAISSLLLENNREKTLVFFLIFEKILRIKESITDALERVEERGENFTVCWPTFSFGWTRRSRRDPEIAVDAFSVSCHTEQAAVALIRRFRRSLIDERFRRQGAR